MSKVIKKKKKNKGFTLMEILVAVLILSILVAISMPLYTRAVERSRTSDPVNTLKSIAKAEQVQKLRAGEYTNQTQDLDLELREYPAGNTVAGDTFEGQYYTYKVYGEDEAAAKATRKTTNPDEEYELSIDYGSGELFCRPAENKTCIDLGLEEGRDFNPWPHKEDCNPSLYNENPNYFSCVRTLYKNGTKHDTVCRNVGDYCYVYDNDGKKIQELFPNSKMVYNYDPNTQQKTAVIYYNADGSLQHYQTYENGKNKETFWESSSYAYTMINDVAGNSSNKWWIYYYNNPPRTSVERYENGSYQYTLSYDSSGQISSVQFNQASGGGVNANVYYNATGEITSSNCFSGACDGWTPPSRDSFTYDVPERPQSTCLEDNPDNPIVCGV